jgi:hypothetical protein
VFIYAPSPASPLKEQNITFKYVGGGGVETINTASVGVRNISYELPNTFPCNLDMCSLWSPADFTSVNSFQEDVKFSSPSFYNLTPPPPPTSRPPPYEVQNFPTPTKTPPSNTPVENYYAATDIVKVSKPFPVPIRWNRINGHSKILHCKLFFFMFRSSFCN